ncbi:hypothetical protein [Methylocella sp.]|jgi:hypothetical protein|uniref:hypothetical protein n=1 Tax=Methylocella sp. TaxID=1978226 RepID=UPI003C236026
MEHFHAKRMARFGCAFSLPVGRKASGAVSLTASRKENATGQKVGAIFQLSGVEKRAKVNRDNFY